MLFSINYYRYLWGSWKGSNYFRKKTLCILYR